MWEFIILGQVPGTSFVLTFVGWLCSLPVCALVFYLVVVLKRQQAFTYVLMFVTMYFSLHPLRRSQPDDQKLADAGTV